MCAICAYINRKRWWHVPPSDPNAYRKRGKFYASTYREAEFYGRPADNPERVNVCNPLVGDEAHIEDMLLGCRPSEQLADLEGGLPVIEARHQIDARLKEAALAHGYDAIVLLSPQGYARYLSSGTLPRSIELNVLEPSEAVLVT